MLSTLTAQEVLSVLEDYLRDFALELALSMRVDPDAALSRAMEVAWRCLDDQAPPIPDLESGGRAVSSTNRLRWDPSVVTLSKWITTQIRRGIKNLAMARSDEIAFEVASLDASIGDEDTATLGDYLPAEAQYAQDPLERVLEQAQALQVREGKRFAHKVQSGSASISSIVSSEALAGLLNLQADLEEEVRYARQERLEDLLHWDSSPDVLTSREVPAFMRLLELSNLSPDVVSTLDSSFSATDVSARPVRKRAGERRPMKFVDYVPDPQSECGYRTVDPWVHSGLHKIFTDLH